jgi:hypothetical protein
MKVWKVPLEDGMRSGTAINSKRLDRQTFMRYNIQNRGWIIIDEIKKYTHYVYPRTKRSYSRSKKENSNAHRWNLDVLSDVW